MTVYTSGGSSVHYGFEGNDADDVFATPVAVTKTFGLNTSVNSLSVGTNRFDLNQLGQVEPTAFAYGQQSGTIDVGFTWDDINSHDIFRSIYGASTPSSNVYSYPSGSSAPAEGGTSPAVINPMTIQVDQQLTGAHTYATQASNTTATTIRRKLMGCVATGLSISTSIGATVDGTCSMIFGKEDTTNTTQASSSSMAFKDQVAITGSPLTFAHGTFKVSKGDGLVSLGEIQSANINFNANQNLLYQLGSHHAVDSYRQVFEITGSFQTSFKDLTHLTHLLNQASDDVNSKGISNKSGNTMVDVSSVGAELQFTNGTRHIQVELQGLSFGSHDISGLVPVQPVFEELPFKALAARVEAKVA